MLQLWRELWSTAGPHLWAWRVVTRERQDSVPALQLWVYLDPGNHMEAGAPKEPEGVEGGLEHRLLLSVDAERGSPPPPPDP